MGSRWILAINSSLLLLSGCGIGRSTVRPEIYGQFSKTGPIILDTMTGLEWQVGPDEDTWDEAVAWVDGLGGDWRMPSVEELRGLWDSGINVDNWGPFENNGWSVWSGEVRDSSSAWAFYFGLGTRHWNYRSGSYRLRAFAVRPR